MKVGKRRAKRLGKALQKLKQDRRNAKEIEAQKLLEAKEKAIKERERKKALEERRVTNAIYYNSL